MYVNSLPGFLPIGTTYPLSNILKKLLLGYPGGYYGMSEARVVSSFNHILGPGFGSDLAQVLKF